LPPTALHIDLRVIKVVRQWHRPGIDLCRQRILEREIAEIPIPASLVLDPAAMDPPNVYPPPRNVLMQLGANIGCPDIAQVNFQGPAEPLVVIIAQTKVRFQTAIDARIRSIVDRHAVRFLVSDSG